MWLTSDYMVLTHSIATTNNVQGDEPKPTALERQVQTLTAVVEHLTKQNPDLEEQLRQRNAGHNTQEKDQRGTSADKRYQEGSEGSNAPSRPERPDVSCLSTADIAPPHIVAKMQMMRERMDLMMNALRGRVSSDLDDLVHRTDSPFTTSVNSFPLPLKFRMPQVENYNGNKDPLDHLESFKTQMHLQGIPNEIMYKAFPTTLKGPASI